MEQGLVDEIKKDLKETIANILKDPDVVETYLAKKRPKKVRTQFEESCIKEMVKLAQEVMDENADGDELNVEFVDKLVSSVRNPCFRVKPCTSVSQMKEIYAKLIKKSESSFRFKYQGRLINDKDTPKSLGLGLLSDCKFEKIQVYHLGIPPPTPKKRNLTQKKKRKDVRKERAEFNKIKNVVVIEGNQETPYDLEKVLEEFGEVSFIIVYLVF